LALLIFLIGFRGSGKTTAAQMFPKHAARLDGDHLFATTLRRKWPKIRYEDRNDWSKWPKHQRDAATVADAQDAVLDQVVPGLRQDERHVVADGAVFACDWFRDPLLTVLQRARVIRTAEDAFLYSKPPVDVLFRHIHVRGREDELPRFSNEAAVGEDSERYDKTVRASLAPWRRLDSIADLADEVRRLVGASRGAPR